MRPNAFDRLEAERRLRLRHAVERCGDGHGLSTAETSALQVIAVGDRTWTPAAELRREGLNGATLAGLVTGGWVEPFATEEGQVLTFSCWAAEVLGLEQVERWELESITIEQEDSAGDRTRTTVHEFVETPRWVSRPPPLEPGTPKPRPRPLRLPQRFTVLSLGDQVIRGLLRRDSPSAVDECIAAEEHLMRDVQREDGRLAVDELTGRVVREPLLLFPSHARDGGKIPRARPHKKASKKARRKARARVSPAPA